MAAGPPRGGLAGPQGEASASAASGPSRCAERLVHFAPNYKGNPYQQMLYAGLPGIGARAVPVKDITEHLVTEAESVIPVCSTCTGPTRSCSQPRPNARHASVSMRSRRR